MCSSSDRIAANWNVISLFSSRIILVVFGILSSVSLCEHIHTNHVLSVIGDDGSIESTKETRQREGINTLDESIVDKQSTVSYESETITANNDRYSTLRSVMTAVNVDSSVGSDIGEPQILSEGLEKEIHERIIAVRDYILGPVQTDPKYTKVRSICKNKNSHCALWSISGECEKNPGYMHLYCAPVCFSCEKLHFETRCAVDKDTRNALYPGDLNSMFERIVTDPTINQYEPVILSRPSYAPGDSPNNATYAIGLWMVMFEKALSGDEADRLIELGSSTGYVNSVVRSSEQEVDGTPKHIVDSTRTSTNAWCVDDCNSDTVVRQVITRIEHITRIPEENMEYLQLVRYESGQFYRNHNDYVQNQKDLPCGVRVLTFFMYLNDVQEGGGTHFEHVGITVNPRKGRAVLWPSVLSELPNEIDIRSNHEALPIVQGVKYGANAWIHQRNYKDASEKGCA